MQDVKLVIFDMDGLMFDTERRYCEAAENEYAAMHVDIDINALYDIIGTSNPIDLNRFFKGKPYTEEMRTLMSHSLEKEIDNMCAHGVPVKPGLYELMDVLEQRHIKRVVATSTKIERSGRLLKAANLFDRFDFVITGHEVAHGKPAPDIFLEACRRAGVAPEHALVLEDSINGGLAAKAAAIPFIIVPDIKLPTDEIIRSAYAIVKDLNVVAQLLR